MFGVSLRVFIKLESTDSTVRLRPRYRPGWMDIHHWTESTEGMGH